MLNRVIKHPFPQSVSFREGHDQLLFLITFWEHKAVECDVVPIWILKLVDVEFA
jgi:hypothetical protein